MTNIEKRQLAQSLYIKGNLTKKAIAQAVGCTEKTLRTWIEKYKWDNLKEAHTVTRKQLLADAYAQLKAVNQKIEERGGVPNKELSDAKSILRKEIEALSDNPLHVYVDCFDEVLEWVMRNDPKSAQQISELLLKFLEEKQRTA
jgi:transposase-like protein